tara:strand:+ start:10 stop:2682 length:2673 start_codon:yes stop_codon:yes gene_type:complete
MLNKSITSLVTVFLFAVLSITPSKSQEINLGGFSGNVSTIVTHGLAVRAEDNNCFLVSGNQNTLSDALKSLIGGNPYSGNGGCNYKRIDTYGNTASKVVDVGSVMSDDGRLNFDKGDVIDAGQSVAISFFGNNASGVGLSLSGVAMVNPLLDFNDASFKALTSSSKDHLESDFKLGNAYITAPLSSNVDLTIGNYVQSQGVTALFPIGVNVVNSVSLPILRSPGAQLKDALLPQAMVGASIYLDGGVTMDAYYQLEQKEIELDAAGTFFGSDLVGVGNQTGIISSALYNEDSSLPVGQVYFNVAKCVEGLNSVLGLASAACNTANSDHTWDTNTDAWSHFHELMDQQLGTGYAVNALGAAVAGLGANIDTVLQSTIGAVTGLAAIYDTLPGHAVSTETSLSDTAIRTAYQRMVSQYPGFGDMSGLLYIRRAPDAKADNSGQYGLNLTGYIDDFGSGVEWGAYFNNSHSNSPRIRMLGITDGYGTDLYALLSALTTSAGAGGLGQYKLTDGTTTLTEEVVASLALGQNICALVSAVDGAFAGGAGAGTATHLFDPGKCYAAQVAAGVDGAMLSAAVAATGTLGFANAGRYQLYYPEDIKTYGLSLATNINGWASNLEVAYRPEFPLQISASDLVNNLIDSTYGTVVQSTTVWANPLAKAAVASMVAGANWSATPRCDISSATSKVSAEMSGYSVCDGTAEFDVWTANTNFVKTFTASEPFVQSAGADGAFLLVDIGAVSVPDLNYNQGVVASGQFQSGTDVYQNGCKDSNGITSFLTPSANALFGNGYCEASSGADDFALAYKLRGGLTYNNFNNSPWSFSPSIGFNHDVAGNAPSSIGGFVEDRMSATATASFTNGGMTTSLSYQLEMGDELNNSSTDKDYLSANFSYAF